jgi:phosphoribosyl-AMP cyclohydrolase
VSDQPIFTRPGSTAELEEGQAFTPIFDADGLITCVVVDASSGDALMVAHMNAAALAKSIETAEAWFYSRSRRKLWKKGESSGHTLRVVEMRVDCDQDALLLKVEQASAGACHTGRRSCFYRAVALGKPAQSVSLQFVDADRMFDPATVYGKPGK